ncbi:MAG: 4-hydroxythreonine-4-phosphate dehydrogenase PdxA [Rhodobacteraceae bacterium]|nr:4-hydroxythreonine-4-phosphate dehydrogenase PdxA [Paracoccaceae bacterium]
MIAPIALTCGEPAGIGPELALKAWQVLRGKVPFFLIADPGHMAALPGNVPLATITDPAEAIEAGRRALPLLAHAFPAANRPGQPDPENAASVIAVIDRAVSLVQSGAASAICTGPIHKKALQDGAGFAFPGHTEYLAHLGGVARSVMMLAAPGLRVVPVTIHIPLSEVPIRLTEALLEDTIRITARALASDFGLAAPRLAIAGLNPHAGEGGAMGLEEISLIAPLIERLKGEGLHLSGPHSADTMFHAEARSQYDAAICMYHDQALIPLKTLDFHGGTNITLGLPFIRTSPDHGTALDIAGKGRANPSSLIAALKQAATMAERRAP